MNIAEAAELVSVSKSTIRRAIEHGDAARVQVTPALVRLTADSLVTWIADGMETEAS